MGDTGCQHDYVYFGMCVSCGFKVKKGDESQDVEREKGGSRRLTVKDGISFTVSKTSRKGEGGGRGEN